MSIQAPSHAKVKEAFRKGEGAVIALFDEFGGQLTELAQQLQKQSEIIQELQARLSKNSQNNSKPPSSDGYGKQNRTTSLRPKEEKPNGGQLGHTGETLKSVESPDEIETHEQVCCKECQASLKDVDIFSVEERQVFDIPAMKIVVTAHQATIKICPECQTENKGAFPEDVVRPVQYGNGVKTVASHLNNEHFTPVACTAQVILDLYGQAPSEATILKANKQLNQHIQPARKAVKEMLHQESVINADETGLRVDGKLHWLHSVSTDKLTDYEVHPKRRKKTMDAAGVLDGYQGKLVHDHWKPYFVYEDSEHIACNAHHMRELKYIENQYQQPWAGETATLLIEIKNAVDDVKHEQKQLNKKLLLLFKKRYDMLISKGLKQNPYIVAEVIEGQPKKRGQPKQTPDHNLLARLRDIKSGTLAFMYDFSVPFDNNLAEQDVRMVKVKQKISGGFRTQEGAKQFASIRGYISTTRKNSVTVFSAIQDAFSGNPHIPAPQP